MRWPFGLCVVVLMLLAAGCEDSNEIPVYPVRGKLLVKGQPAERAFVIFHRLEPIGQPPLRPRAQVRADGSFELTTYETNDGAPEGEYTVTLFWPEPPKDPTGHPDMGPDRLKGRYRKPENSPWKIQIQPGENELETFEIP